jgi:rubrerythrin
MSLSPDKALAIGAYGESVAAYRYLIFAEHVQEKAHRDAFAAMADEEQEHKQRLQKLLARTFPDADFVLSDEDKQRVVAGPRLPDIRDERSFAEALEMTLQTEQRTSAFYRDLAHTTADPHLRSLFKELAEEGAEHYQRLRDLIQAVTVGNQARN